MVYASYFYSTLNSHVLVLKSTYLHMLYNVILPCILWPVTMLSDVTDVWQYDLITLTLTLSSKNRKLKNKIKMKNENENK